MSTQSFQRPSVFEGVEMGVGTWSWGDRLFWGFGREYENQDVKSAFKVCLDAGLIFFDTAETYGQGKSESLLGEFSRSFQQPIRIATKFMPYPWRFSRRSLLKALNGSLERLGREKLELYQVHWPLPPVRIETWMDAMAEAVQSGKIDAVGVSNYDRAQTQRAYDVLRREGIALASNQVEYHLLNRRIETNGLLKFCQNLEVKIISYSPLAQGILSGKYTSQNPPRGIRASKYSRKLLEEIRPLIVVLMKIGSDHGGKSAAQVAINWCICKGTLPIPGAKSLQQAEQNAGAVGWRLTDAEVNQLDETSDKVLRNL